MNYREKVLNYQKDLINDLVGWVKQKSVYDETTITKGAPFGEGVKNSLDYICNIAKRDNFKVTNYDGYVSEIEYGSGEEIVMILGHADVVPEGTGWKYDPYEGKIVDNLLYGRGSSDDKGPTLCAYYALKIIRDLGIEANKTIRIVIGGNEEKGSRCLDYYFNTIKRPHPTLGFTPDAEFPLIYGEKGILSYEYKGKFTDNLIEYIDGGEVINAVAGKTTIRFNQIVNLDNEFFKLLDKYYVSHSIRDENNKTVLELEGKSAHASTPEKGINALSIGLYALSLFTTSELANHFGPLFLNYYGRELGIKTRNHLMGKLTMNLGLGHYENGEYSFGINIRYPNNITGEKIKNKLDKHIMHEGTLLSDSHPLFVDPKSKLVKTLMNAYKEVTNDAKARPITIGGGTYARETINTVAFGMDFLRNNGTGNIHTLNEAINLDDLVDGTEIYLKAIIGLLEI